MKLRRPLSLILVLFCLSNFACGNDDAISETPAPETPDETKLEDTASQGLEAKDIGPGEEKAVDTSNAGSDTLPIKEDIATTASDAQTDSSENDSKNTEAVDIPPAPPKEVRFVAFGDAGKGNSGQKAVAKAIKEKCDKDGCDFIMLLGDNIYDSGVDSVPDPQWQTKFEEPYAELDIVFRPSLGNHDNGGLTLGIGGPPIDVFGEGGGTGMEFARGDIQVEYSAVSEKWDMPSRYYDWVQGSAHFYALDTNSMMFDQHAEQAEVMVEKISQSTATWKIAYGHHPYVSNGRHGNAGSYDLPDWLGWLPSILGDLGDTISGTAVKAGLETIVCSTGIDIYLSGHDHNRQWLPGPSSCSNVEFIISGAGATTTDFQNNQTAYYGDDKTPGFIWIKITDSTLHAEFIDTTGTINFVRDLTK